MAIRDLLTSRIGKYVMGFIVGVPILTLVFAPFPLGMGVIYPIWDNLRGHPQGMHGTHPQRFVGLWIRDEVKMYDFVGQAFYLMPDGEFATTPTMTERRWHYDNNSLFIDSFSHCGNCFRGNVTSEYAIRIAGVDQMFVENKHKNATRGVSGLYHRLQITDSLKSELNRLKKSEDENESFKADSVLRAIEHFETLSKFKNGLSSSRSK